MMTTTVLLLVQYEITPYTVIISQRLVLYNRYWLRSNLCHAIIFLLVPWKLVHIIKDNGKLQCIKYKIHQIIDILAKKFDSNITKVTIKSTMRASFPKGIKSLWHSAKLLLMDFLKTTFVTNHTLVDSSFEYVCSHATQHFHAIAVPRLIKCGR